MEYVQVGEEILVVEDLLTAGSKVGTVGKHYCFAKKLIIEGDQSPLTIKLVTWEDAPIIEDLEITVSINGVESAIRLVQGQIDLDLSTQPGQYTVLALAPSIDIGKKSITVI